MRTRRQLKSLSSNKLSSGRWVGLLALGMSLPCLAAADVGSLLQLAALDSIDGEPPSCGQDNICNLAACASDPDCPAGVGNDNTITTVAETALEAVTNCDATQEQDIRAVAWNIADDWANFVAAIQLQTSFSVGDCLHDRFSKNGKVQCESKDKCKDSGVCRQGHSFPGKHEIKIYPDFLNRIKNYTQPDRRACYAALLTHEFTHSCWFMENRPEAREDAAFAYWQNRFPGTAGFDINNPSSGCGSD
jgi:hypothetical protein